MFATPRRAQCDAVRVISSLRRSGFGLGIDLEDASARRHPAAPELELTLRGVLPTRTSRRRGGTCAAWVPSPSLPTSPGVSGGADTSLLVMMMADKLRRLAHECWCRAEHEKTDDREPYSWDARGGLISATP